MTAANSINVSSPGLVGFNGTSFDETALTAHNVLVGGATSDTIANIAPNAVVGHALVSNGAAADPSFSTTIIVAGGGTGAVTLTGLVTGNGTAAMTASPITQHDVLVGGATNAVTSVAPSATAGVPLVSSGAAADPAFGTAVVAGGGTGLATLTAYELMAAGTTSTGAMQQIGIGTAGQILKSNGAGSLPSFQAATVTPFPWTDEAATFSAVAENGYFVTAASTANLPAGSAQGDTIEFVNAGAGVAGIVVTANGTDLIQIGSAVSAAGGTATSNVSGDSVTLVYQLASTTWFSTSVLGTWPVV